MTKEQALAILNQLIGELPFKTVHQFKLVEVFNCLNETPKLAEAPPKQVP